MMHLRQYESPSYRSTHNSLWFVSQQQPKGNTTMDNHNVVALQNSQADALTQILREGARRWFGLAPA